MAFTDLLVNPAISMDVSQSFGNFGAAVNLALNFASSGKVQFTNGSGAGQAAQLYAKTNSVASGTPQVLDLNSLTQPDGSAANFTDFVLLAVKNNHATSTLTMGGGTNEVTSLLGSGSMTVLPGTTVIVLCPVATGSAYAVTASTAHTLQFTSSSGTISYDILILGH